MSDPQDEPTTLTDDEVQTHHFDTQAATTADDAADDAGSGDDAADDAADDAGSGDDAADDAADDAGSGDDS